MRRLSVTFYYRELVQRTALIDVDFVADEPGALESLGQEELARLHGLVAEASPLLTPVDPNETIGAIIVDFEDVRTGESATLGVQPQWAPPNQAAGEIASSCLEEQMASIVAQLSDSPVFAMSRGSRELFHSDLLAWLLDKRRGTFLPILLRAAGLEVRPDASGSVKREFSSFDLLVDVDESTSLLIENKLKSVPRREQLVQYAAKAARALKGRDVRRVLLSPSPPITQGQGADLVAQGDWSHLSYASLAEAVEELANGETGHEAWLLREYARVVRLLLNLREVCSVARTSRFLPGPDYEILRSKRLHDLVYKWRYEELARAIEARLGDSVHLDDGIGNDRNYEAEVAITTGFTNGTALVDLKASAATLPKDRADASPLVGVQLQHDRMRIAVENVSAVTAERLLFSEAARKVLDGLWGALRLKERPRGERAVNHYGPWFHYRYVVVGEATLDEIGEAMILALDGMVGVARGHSGGAS